jgi:serine/threonine protein kinase
MESGDPPLIYEYRFVSCIAAGGIGDVYLAEDSESHEPSAIKVYSKNALHPRVSTEEPVETPAEEEARLLETLESRYILSANEVINNAKTNSVLLVFPYAPLGPLSCQISNLEQSQLAVAFYQTAEALRYLHSLNVVHRDVHPSHVLVFRHDYFVLSKFSVACKLAHPDECLNDVKGSAPYVAPEVLAGEPYRPKPVDVWAFGVMVYFASFGKLPFCIDTSGCATFMESLLVVADSLAENGLEFPETDNNGIVALIRGCLSRDPMKRWTFQQVVECDIFAEGRELDERMRQEDLGALRA